MARARRRGGDLSPAIGGREALRALLIGTVSLTLVGIAVHLSFRQLDLEALTHQMELGREEAETIADVVAALGRQQDGLDFSMLRDKRPTLEQHINERISLRPFVRNVEVLDRFGGRLLYLSRRSTGPLLYRDEAGAPPGDEAEEHIVTAQLRRGAHTEGEVRVGIAREAVWDELEQLRRSLSTKVTIAAACALGVLILGLLYVMFLIRKNRRLEQSRLAAERRAYVGLLASGLAHEIRNPLNAMNMNLQMMEEELRGVPGLDSGDHTELLGATKSEIKRLERLVNNFLAYARPAAAQFADHDLNSVIQDVARFLQADFRQSGVELELRLEELLPTVELDETQFKQALMNLLVNARQVLENGGRVVVSTSMSVGGDAVVEVRDNGPGIPEEMRERVFEVFYSNRGGGTGLGLPIARQIVERHGGSIEVATETGQGTTFTIRLPRRHSRSAAASRAASAAT